MPMLVAVKTLPDYRVHLTFDDGVEGVADLSDMVGLGIFDRWKDYANFENAHVGEYGELAFDEDIDFCPDALYLEVTGKDVSEIFPKSKAHQTHA